MLQGISSERSFSSSQDRSPDSVVITGERRSVPSDIPPELLRPLIPSSVPTNPKPSSTAIKQTRTIQLQTTWSSDTRQAQAVAQKTLGKRNRTANVRDVNVSGGRDPSSNLKSIRVENLLSSPLSSPVGRQLEISNFSFSQEVDLSLPPADLETDMPSAPPEQLVNSTPVFPDFRFPQQFVARPSSPSRFTSQAPLDQSESIAVPLSPRLGPQVDSRVSHPLHEIDILPDPIDVAGMHTNVTTSPSPITVPFSPEANPLNDPVETLTRILATGYPSVGNPEYLYTLYHQITSQLQYKEAIKKLNASQRFHPDHLRNLPDRVLVELYNDEKIDDAQIKELRQQRQGVCLVFTFSELLNLDRVAISSLNQLGLIPEKYKYVFKALDKLS